jgi:predicted RNase H-like HicB family nuclease
MINKTQTLNTFSSYTLGMKTFTAIIQKEEDMYVAKCPEIGTVSQGVTIEEAISNLKEATELYMEEFPSEEKTHPICSWHSCSKS